LDSSLEVAVEPNPFGDYTMLWFSNPKGAVFELTITDVQGRVVRRYEEVREDVVRIEREELSAGVYWYRLSGSGGVGLGKLVVE